MEEEIKEEEGSDQLIQDEAANMFDDEEDIECTLYRIRIGNCIFLLL